MPVIDADEVALLEGREIREAEMVEQLGEVAGLVWVGFVLGWAISVISWEDGGRFEEGWVES